MELWETRKRSRQGSRRKLASERCKWEREVRELRQVNEILRKASAYFAQAEFDRSAWRSPTAIGNRRHRGGICCLI
ncbi:hypothetical protein DID99_33840 [Burkholderia sp. Bp8986]|nr:hypothetical protein DID99_33840 [Burkholderia sp. Bp8986]